MSIEFTPVSPLDRNHDLLEQIAGFVDAGALRALAGQFNVSIPSSGSLLERLKALEQGSDVWDFRGGKERNLIESVSFDRQTAALVVAAATALGLVLERPPSHSAYDHVLILGGLVRACISRPAQAFHLLDTGAVRSPSVIALGGFRVLAGNELTLVAQVGHPGLGDEFEAMEAGVRDAFSISTPPYDDDELDSPVLGASWRVRQLQREAPSILVVAAPSTDPGARRANTADTYQWFASNLVNLRPGQRILLITSSIYVPFQHADAIRMLALPFGVDVDTVGVSTQALAPPLRQEFAPESYLQEVRSTIRSYRLLVEAIDAERSKE